MTTRRTHLPSHPDHARLTPRCGMALGLFCCLFPFNALANGFDVEVVTPAEATVEVVEPPPSLRKNDLQSDTILFVIEEKVSLTLEAPLEVDLVTSTRRPGTLAGGTVVDGYLVHFDPVSRNTGLWVRLTFPEPILGLIFESSSLIATDSLLGPPGTVFETQDRFRGIDGNDGTSINLAGDGRTIGLNLDVTTHLDEMRILVPSTRVPPDSADFNADGIVDGKDFLIWQASFQVNAAADANGDGQTDGADFLIWQHEFESAGADAPATATEVPEPAAAGSLLLALAAIVASRKTAQQNQPTLTPKP